MKSFLVAFVAMSSLLAFAQSTRQTTEREAIDRLIESTKELAQSDLSCVADSDCVVMELGRKACGGPSSYTWTSQRNHNYQEVSFLAQKTREKESAYNARFHVISDCTMRVPPTVECERRTCKVRYDSI